MRTGVGIAWPRNCGRDSSPHRARSSPSTCTTRPAVRCMSRSPSSTSTTRPAPRCRSSPARSTASWTGTGRPSSSSSDRGPRARPVRCWTRCIATATTTATCPSTSRPRPCVMRRARCRRPTRTWRSTRSRATSNIICRRSRAPGRTRCGWSRSWAGRSATSPRTSAPEFLRDVGDLLGPEDVLLMGVDLDSDPERTRRAYDDAGGRHGGVQPQRAAGRQP